MAGGSSIVNGRRSVSEDAQQFKNKDVPDTMSLVFTEKYGPKSFFRNTYAAW